MLNKYTCEPKETFTRKSLGLQIPIDSINGHSLNQNFKTNTKSFENFDIS